MNLIATLSAATLLVSTGSAFAQGDAFKSAEFGRDGVPSLAATQRVASDVTHLQAFGRDVPATRPSISAKVAPNSAQSGVVLERVGRS